ncbi:MAG: glycosyltransferase family 4 protein [Pseudomonadota bacterium]
MARWRARGGRPGPIVNIAHLELGRHQYGGALQVRHLLNALEDGVHNHRLVTAAESDLHAWAEAEGQPHAALKFRGEHDVMFVVRLARWLRANRIDLLHVHSRRGADWMGPLAAGVGGAACILTRRVDHPPPLWLRWMVARRYLRVVGISDAISTVLRDGGIEDDALLTIRSAIDPVRIDAAPTVDLRTLIPGCSEDAPVIAVIAQLIDRKGHRFLIEGLGGLRAKFPDLRVAFFGRGGLRKELETAVHAAGHADCVWFAGFRDDLLSLLPSVSVVVHPAVREGLGVSLLQAAAARVPVVGFATGGLTEAVVHEHTGLLVRVGDAVALSAAISRILADDELASRLGDNGRRRIEAEFSIPVMARRYAALYDVLAEEI